MNKLDSLENQSPYKFYEDICFQDYENNPYKTLICFYRPGTPKEVLMNLAQDLNESILRRYLIIPDDFMGYLGTATIEDLESMKADIQKQIDILYEMENTKENIK